MTHADPESNRAGIYRVARAAATSLTAVIRVRAAQRRVAHVCDPNSPVDVVAAQRAGRDAVCWVGARDVLASPECETGEQQRLAQGRRYDEAAAIVRAVLIARDVEQRRIATRRLAAVTDYAPRIIADVGGGDATIVRGRIRRFVEVGVPGFCVDDAGAGGIVPLDEHVQQLTAARLQLTEMDVPGVLVARTSAGGASSIAGRAGDVDDAFVLGATKLDLPPYRLASLALMRRFGRGRADELSGYRPDETIEGEWEDAERWLRATGVSVLVDRALAAVRGGDEPRDGAYRRIFDQFTVLWRREACVRTWGEVTAMKTVPPIWDREHTRTFDGRDQVRGGIDYAVARARAIASYSDVIVLEAREFDLGDAERFARAIRATHPQHVLAYEIKPRGAGTCCEHAWRASEDRLASFGYSLQLCRSTGVVQT